MGSINDTTNAREVNLSGLVAVIKRIGESVAAKAWKRERRQEFLQGVHATTSAVGRVYDESKRRHKGHPVVTQVERSGRSIPTLAAPRGTH